MSPINERFFDELLLLHAKRDLLSEVGDAINGYDSLFYRRENYIGYEVL